jgi:hypothetical protein
MVMLASGLAFLLLAEPRFLILAGLSLVGALTSGYAAAGTIRGIKEEVTFEDTDA